MYKNFESRKCELTNSETLFFNLAVNVFFTLRTVCWNPTREPGIGLRSHMSHFSIQEYLISRFCTLKYNPEHCSQPKILDHNGLFPIN